LIDTSTPLLRLVNVLVELETTTSRNRKIKTLSSFLRELPPDEISPAIMLVAGSIFPEGDKRVLEVSGITLSKILTKGRQSTLQKQPLTITNVHNLFQEIAALSGKGSRSKREAILLSLLSQTSEIEEEYIIRMLLGELRVGLAEGLILESISNAANVEVELVRRTYSLTGDLGETAKRAITEHEEGLKRTDVTTFEPIKPMLADTAPDLETVFRAHHGRTAFDYKLDGARVQIHKQDHHVEIFSRRLAKITSSLPELVELTCNNLKANEAILEGEVVAVDTAGRPMPFQELMRRFRRIADIKEAISRVPVRLYLFDVLYFEGRPMFELPQDQRRLVLEEACPPELLTPTLVTSNMEEAREFFNKAIREGHEGLIAKAPDGRYRPGQRGKEWLKVKPAETLDAVIIAADWGSGRRHSWLSNYHLAVRDPETNEFLVVGKTFKGLTDDEFESMTSRLEDLGVNESRNTVYVKPEIVVEVAFDEVQTSPHYRSGYALRFARIVRIREDKAASDADTLDKVRDIQKAMFNRKARPRSSA
jgi:DNA ligase-1